MCQSNYVETADDGGWDTRTIAQTDIRNTNGSWLLQRVSSPPSEGGMVFTIFYTDATTIDTDDRGADARAEEMYTPSYKGVLP